MCDAIEYLKIHICEYRNVDHSETPLISAGQYPLHSRAHHSSTLPSNFRNPKREKSHLFLSFSLELEPLKP